MQIPSPIKKELVTRLSDKYDDATVANIVTTIVDCFLEFDLDTIVDEAMNKADLERDLVIYREAKDYIDNTAKVFGATVFDYKDVNEGLVATNYAKGSLGYLYIIIGNPLNRSKLYIHIGYTRATRNDRHIQDVAHEFIRKKGCATSNLGIVCEVSEGPSIADKINTYLQERAENVDGLMFRKSKQCFVCTSKESALFVFGYAVNACGYTFDGEYYCESRSDVREQGSN